MTKIKSVETFLVDCPECKSNQAELEKIQYYHNGIKDDSVSYRLSCVECQHYNFWREYSNNES